MKRTVREFDSNKLEFAIVEFEVEAFVQHNPTTTHVIDDINRGGQFFVLIAIGDLEKLL